MTKKRSAKTTDLPEPKDPGRRTRNELIQKDRMFGATFERLAAAYGLSKTHVFRIAGGVPIFVTRPRPPPKSRKRPERAMHFARLRAQARELRKRGFSYRQIEEQTGLSRAAAYAAARLVKITGLEGRAWLSHESGRPRAWMRELLAANHPGDR